MLDVGNGLLPNVGTPSYFLPPFWCCYSIHFTLKYLIIYAHIQYTIFYL